MSPASVSCPKCRLWASAGLPRRLLLHLEAQTGLARLNRTCPAKPDLFGQNRTCSATPIRGISIPRSLKDVPSVGILSKVPALGVWRLARCLLLHLVAQTVFARLNRTCSAKTGLVRPNRTCSATPIRGISVPRRLTMPLASVSRPRCRLWTSASLPGVFSCIL